MPHQADTSFDIGDKVTCCVYGKGVIIAKQPKDQINRWFDGIEWIQVLMPNYPYTKVYFDISGRCAEEGDWLVNYPTLYHEMQRPIVEVVSENYPFYLRDRVFDLMWGKGTIISVDWNAYRPFRVVFDIYPYRYRDGYPQSLLYRADGTRFQRDSQRLFHEVQLPRIITSKCI
ncbi:hypothetical protein QLG02_08035 [Aeromonas sp. V90_14]|uniref:hypothetical protein n=1 Tax=Aeromonas sp. V90_14 TaxID=3044241 RepID=UPI00249E5011|nr:hypothetical protein [Aeromonas sp. V90_14]MDI3430275.1 hypothetical protein [Aeromonas sp. V90_14]